MDSYHYNDPRSGLVLFVFVFNNVKTMMLLPLIKKEDGRISCVELILSTVNYFLYEFDGTDCFETIFRQIACLLMTYFFPRDDIPSIFVAFFMCYCSGVQYFYSDLILKHVIMFVLKYVIILPNTTFIASYTVLSLFGYMFRCNIKSKADVLLVPIFFLLLKCFDEKIDIFIILILFALMCIWIECKYGQFLQRPK